LVYLVGFAALKIPFLSDRKGIATLFAKGGGRASVASTKGYDTGAEPIKR